MANATQDGVAIRDIEFASGPKNSASLVVQQYAAPASGKFDPFEEADRALARYTAEVLVAKYSGYDWFVESDIGQGVVTFKIPDLMGASLKCVINVIKHPDVPSRLIEFVAGEALERMGLPRGPVTKAQILEAKKRLHTFQFDDVGKKRA